MHSTAPADDTPQSRTSRARKLLPTASWVLYDFSDTIFSASILTFYFPLWVTEDVGGTDTHFTLALSGSMLLVALTGPMLGTLSDRLNRRVPLLAVSVITCAVCTGLIGMFGGLATGLVLFILANFLYQSGLIFYNTLIVNVSGETNRGIISGIGIGAGYIGLIVTFLALSPWVDTVGNEAAFLPTALLYVAFAIPLFIFVKENSETNLGIISVIGVGAGYIGLIVIFIAFSPWADSSGSQATFLPGALLCVGFAIPLFNVIKEIGSSHKVDLGLVKESYQQLYRTFKRARQHANLFRFLVARFLYMEAVNTVTSLFVIYLTTVGDFEQSEARTMIILAVVIAIFSSWFTGWCVSKFGPKRVLSVALLGWIAVVLAASVAWEQWMYWAIAGVMGLFWAGPQIADRVLLTNLSPQGQVGEFFGLFQMSGRLSAVVGPALWALTTWALLSLGDTRFRIAVLVIAIFLILGYFVLNFVHAKRESSDLDDIENE